MWYNCEMDNPMLSESQDETSDVQFWSKMGGLGLRGVLAEADRLEREKSSLSDGKRALAFDHYRAFIVAAECGKKVQDRVETAHQKAQDAGRELPHLRQKSLEFEESSQVLLQRRKRLSLVLSKHTSLLEILELPQLVETAVRNQEYEQALQLRSFAARIDKKLGHIPIVAQVVQAVHTSAGAMVQQLLSQLKAPIQLPACLKVVGYLRRTDAFTDADLRLRFLQARDSWLTNLLLSVPKDDPQEHLTKTMDLTRVHLFDIVTQYRALFSDDDPLLLAPAPSRGQPAGPGVSSHRLLFSSWLQRRVGIFLKSMEDDLDRGAQIVSLESITGQAMYFGQSFGRVGADFRLSLVALLTKSAREAAFKHLDGTERRFANGIEQLALKAEIPGRQQTAADQEADPLRPPSVLMEFLPLAELCNAVLSSLNQIRLAAPLALAMELVAKVQFILESASRTLSDKEKRFSKTSTETEVKVYQRLVQIFTRELVPYLDRCLREAFPPAQLAAVIPGASAVIDSEAIYRCLPEGYRPEIVMKPALPTVTLEGATPPAKNPDQRPSYVVDRTELIAEEIAQSQVPAEDSK